MNNTEHILIQQLCEGEESAYRVVFERHYAVLCHVANEYVHDDYFAETIVGDVIFHLWEVRSTLNITTSLRSYLLQAVRHRCLDHLKSTHVQFTSSFSTLAISELTDDNHADIPSKPAHPLGLLLEKELEDKIMIAVANLPDECREVFEKSRFEGQKYEEIATELGISVNTVKYHIKNALQLLRTELGKYLILFLIFLK